MTFNLLISCMHQKDTGIIQRTNVQSDVIIVNQCDKESIEEFDFINKKGRSCHGKFICTIERGLSKSRNMALQNSWGDICLICDDDEVLEDDCEEKILRAYHDKPDAALIAFALIRKDNGKKYPKEKNKLGYKQILKTSSLQISFSRELIINHRITFDEKMGSGTGNGGGEENMFMFTVKKNGLKMFYYPDIIATVNPGESQWFQGYNERYFENLGWSNRRLFGSVIGLVYLFYWAIFRRNIYSKDGLSVYKALKSSMKGYLSKR